MFERKWFSELKFQMLIKLFRLRISWAYEASKSIWRTQRSKNTRCLIMLFFLSFPGWSFSLVNVVMMQFLKKLLKALSREKFKLGKYMSKTVMNSLCGYKVLLSYLGPMPIIDLVYHKILQVFNFCRDSMMKCKVELLHYFLVRIYRNYLCFSSFVDL